LVLAGAQEIERLVFKFRRMTQSVPALGKVLLAYRSESEIDDLIKKHGLLRHNENTIGSARKLKENLALVRKLGYALDDEEEELGIRCMGAPIFDSQGHEAAAVSVSGTTSQMERERLGPLSEQVKRTARAISDQLGWPADAWPDKERLNGQQE
jgi:DNA-binding IclR family transcriptional regulator